MTVFENYTYIGEPIPCATNSDNDSGVIDKIELRAYNDQPISLKGQYLNHVPVLQLSAYQDKDFTETWLTTASARDLITALTFWVTETEKKKEEQA